MDIRVITILLLVVCGLLSANTGKLELRYARNFSVSYSDSHVDVTVRQPWADEGEVVESYRFYEPPERAVVGSTTFLAFFEELGLADRIIGVSDYRHVNASGIRAQIEEGVVREIGRGATLNVEVLYSLKPDLLLLSGLGTPVETAYPKLFELGLPVIMTAAYMEETPLARAEWIKFIGVIFGREKEAERIFSAIEVEYLRLASLVGEVEHRPLCFYNVPWGGTWYVPGGNSFKAGLLAEAGGKYVWENNDSRKSLPLDLEAVYAKAADAAIWFDVGEFASIQALEAADERYSKFRAAREGRVYNSDLRMNGHGGNDFWERGTLHAEEVLADLISIIHPELLPKYKPVFYRQLNGGNVE